MQAAVVSYRRFPNLPLADFQIGSAAKFGRRRTRKENRKTSALANHRVDMNSAVGFPDEPLHDAKPQAGPLSPRLGREVRFKQPGQGRGRDAGAAVLDAQRDECRLVF